MTDSINYTSERIEKLIHPLPRGSKFNTELIFPKYFTFSLNFIHIQNYGIVFFVFLRKYLGKYDRSQAFYFCLKEKQTNKNNL